MRRVLALAALGAVGAAGLVAAGGSAKLPPIRATCTSTTGLDVYFWPKGHPAVPALGFPALAAPHVELYQGRSAANDAQLVYLDRNRYQLTGTCSSAGTENAAPAVSSARTSTDQQKIRCELPANVDVRLSALWRTKVITAKRPVLVTVNGKKHRKLVKKRLRVTELLGTRATARAAGSTGTILSVEVTKTLRVTWDSRACAAVPLSG